MPFIDVFSMLNTFLLFSAVFLSIGVIEVQIPFLSNAAPPKEVKRTIDIAVDIEKDKVELQTSWSAAPRDEQKTQYNLNEQGMAELHAKLVALRKQHQDTDKVTVYSADEVTFKDITLVLDTIRERNDSDPVFTERDEKTNETRSTPFVYSKIVMGSVML